MLAFCYCPLMRCIEEVRLENYQTLVKELRDELGRTPLDVEIAARTGLSTVYVHQLKKGKRTNIQSVAARKMEDCAGKPPGWMDADRSLWPFPGIDAPRWQSLTRDQQIEIQGLVRERIEKFEANKGNALRNGTDG
jgi:hypothetical protein